MTWRDYMTPAEAKTVAKRDGIRKRQADVRAQEKALTIEVRRIAQRCRWRMVKDRENDDGC